MKKAEQSFKRHANTRKHEKNITDCFLNAQFSHEPVQHQTTTGGLESPLGATRQHLSPFSQVLLFCRFISCAIQPSPPMWSHCPYGTYLCVEPLVLVRREEIGISRLQEYEVVSHPQHVLCPFQFPNWSGDLKRFTGRCTLKCLENKCGAWMLALQTYAGGVHTELNSIHFVREIWTGSVMIIWHARFPVEWTAIRVLHKMPLI